MMYKNDILAIRPKSPGRHVANLAIILTACSMLFLSACSSDKTADKKADQNDQTSAANQRDIDSAKTRQQDNSVDLQYTPPDIPVDLNGTPVEVAGARFVPDTKWEVIGVSGKMVAHYRYGPLSNEAYQGEVTVFFFGDEPNDSQEIMERWMDQISIADGRDSRSTARVHSRQVGGMTAHVLSIDGIYTPPSEGFDREDTGVRDYCRLVGVVLEAPAGLVYFKLTGPDYTGRVMIDQFMNMIYRVKKT